MRSTLPCVAETDRAVPKRVCIVSASGQNVFFAELLDAIGKALACAGLDVERSVDRFPSWRDDDVYLFVPHEYLPLVQDAAHPDAMQLGRSVVVCTEQPGTSWFEQSAAVAARAAAVLDINPLGVDGARTDVGSPPSSYSSAMYQNGTPGVVTTMQSELRMSLLWVHTRRAALVPSRGAPAGWSIGV